MEIRSKVGSGLASSPTVFSRTAGGQGWGVSTLWRGASILPFSSMTEAFRPVPPMSMDRILILAFLRDLVSQSCRVTGARLRSGDLPLRLPLGPHQVEGGVDQGDMRKRLREIPELSVSPWDHTPRPSSPTSLLSAEQALEQPPGVLGDAGPAGCNCRRARSCRRGTPLRRAAAHRRPRSGVVAQHEPVDAASRCSIAFDRADDARIVGRQKADQGQQQQARVERASTHRPGRSCPARDRTPWRRRRRWMPVAQPCANARPRPPVPSCSAILTARSKATQAITLEWVKCCGGPRTSQMPSSGWCQIFVQMLEPGACRAAGASLGAEPALAVAHGAAHRHLAIDVELELLGRGVADAHRVRALVARQPGHLPLGQPPLAAEPVHDLHLVGAAGDRAQQPVAPGPRLVVIAGVHQAPAG